MADQKNIPASEFLFRDFCAILEQLKKNKSQEKDTILLKFMEKVRNHISEFVGPKDSTFYPILRLLLPSLERERNAYNLKETKLGAVLVKVLSINKQSRDAQKLLNYRAAQSQSTETDFASIAYFVLKNRISHTSTDMTIGEINAVLNKISEAEAGSKAAVLDEVFVHVMKCLTPDEIKWFLRIVLKDLKVGMSHNRILAAFHPDAPDYYNICEDLSKVCEELADGESTLPELRVRVFSAVSPMLSERLDITKICRTLLPSATYYVESKFDGERFQVHMENGIFEYFSRKGYSYGNHYGKNYESGQLTPLLKGCFNENAQSFIMDGEMMGWNKEHNCFGSKGMAYDVKKLTERSKHRPCFCAFDILYYNGQSLVGPSEKGGLPLHKRLELLDNLFKDVPGVIIHSKRELITEIQTNYTQVLDILNRAIESQDEGIVLKDTNSHYIVSQRNAGWYKIKPEYTENALTDLDLAVIGADEAESKRQGRAKSFHVAVVNVDSSGRSYSCVGRVSSGLSHEERERVCARLEAHWTRVKTRPPPTHLRFNRELPDFWIDPENSLVFQVRATELVRSSSHGAQYALRFPRVVRVRDDKRCSDATTAEDLGRLVAEKGAVVKLGTKRIDEDSIQSHSDNVKRKRSSRVLKVAEQFRVGASGDATAADLPIVSTALEGRRVCILSEDEDCDRRQLAKIVESHGGKHVENVDADVWCCLVGRSTHRTRCLIAAQELDILPTTWLRSLPPSASLATVSPLDMLSTSKMTKLKMSETHDPFGDSYTEPVDVETLKRIFEKMCTVEPPIYLLDREIQSLKQELFGSNSPL